MDEKQALKDLQLREDIIITNADKGGAVVIQDVKDYQRSQQIIKQHNHVIYTTSQYTTFAKSR